MKGRTRLLALMFVLAIMMGIGPLALAANAAESALAKMPAGIYTYVAGAPAAKVDSKAGEVQFIWREHKLVWSFDADGAVKTGAETLYGDELEFFQGIYLSDRPVYDWLSSAQRSTEGYFGDVSGNFLITITEKGKISKLRLNIPQVNVLGVITKAITHSTLTVSGEVRGSGSGMPALQSCITLIGSTNRLHVTDRGNVVLDELIIGSDENGVGLSADKTGGDTFIAGTVRVDGTVEWKNKYANIQPVNADKSATVVTNGQNILVEGTFVGRVGRNLNLSTGEGGGDIIIGANVSTSYNRSGPLENPSTGRLLFSTTGNITAGKGNVIIGTNTERQVVIDSIGDIQGANVTIKPTDNGKPTDMQASIGNITATGKIDIVIGAANIGNAPANVIGNLTAQSGDISFVSGPLNGNVGNIAAPNGAVNLKIAGVRNVGDVSGAKVVKEIGNAAVSNDVTAQPTPFAVLVNGKTAVFTAYNINNDDYFILRDIANALSGTEKQFNIRWLDNVRDAIITLTSNRAYTPIGGEMESKAASGPKTATPTTWTAYLDGKPLTFNAYFIDGKNYFKLHDVAKAFNFGVKWDAAAKTITINTGAGYTPN